MWGLLKPPQLSLTCGFAPPFSTNLPFPTIHPHRPAALFWPLLLGLALRYHNLPPLKKVRLFTSSTTILGKFLNFMVVTYIVKLAKRYLTKPPWFLNASFNINIVIETIS